MMSFRKVTWVSLHLTALAAAVASGSLAAAAPPPQAANAATSSSASSVQPAIQPEAPPAATSANPQEAPGFYLKVEPQKDVHIGSAVHVQLMARDSKFPMKNIEDVTFDVDEKLWHIDSQWRRDWQAKDDGRQGIWHATLRPFELGPLSVPAAKITYQTADGTRAEAQTTTATITVISIRAPAQQQQASLIPMRGPASVPRDWLTILSTLATLVVLALAAWLGWRWYDRHRRRTAFASPEPELPPGLWALRELDQRSRLPVCQTGPAKAVFSHVSEVIRLYLDRRYGILAIDMTTMECLQALHALRLRGEVLRWLEDFLNECDMVKFTTFEPARERWFTVWHDARLIVKMTTPEEELGGAAAGESETQREVAV